MPNEPTKQDASKPRTDSTKPTDDGLGKLLYRRLVGGTRYSLSGLRRALGEEAFRAEVVIAVPMIVLALWLGESASQRALLIAVVVLVLIVELLNTAIEATVDRISTDRHPLSKEAKDLGSAAVLLAIILAALTWVLIIGFG